MRFKGFKQAVKKLAKGRYHCVQHQVTEYQSGRVLEEWSAYVAGATWTKDHLTPEEALLEVEDMCSDLK